MNVAEDPLAGASCLYDDWRVSYAQLWIHLLGDVPWIDNLFLAVFSEYQMSRQDREQLASQLQAGTRPSAAFVLFMVIATALAGIGLLQNSAAVVIGAMLVAPLMTPLLGAGLSLIQGNLPLLRAATRAIAHAG